MTRFIDSLSLALTPLTPIHIGCGEDFEPTNYVIDERVLYHFDPAQIRLTAQERSNLTRAASLQGDEAIRAVQRFFWHKRAQCKQVSRLQIPVAAGVEDWYDRRVGKVVQREETGRKVSNQLEIERTVHHPHSGRPYIPGSSLKGSIRTAWLNHIDPGGGSERDKTQKPSERCSDVEAELLGGKFSSDPFRLVKLADAEGPNVKSRIIFSVDRDKEQRLGRDGQRIEKNLFVRREVIVGGQYRALHGEIRFERLAVPTRNGVPAMDKRIGGYEQLARACNRFYRERLTADLKLIRRRFADDPWVDRFKRLIDALRQDLDDGRAMLLRVGRHSGAESVTLEKRRWIRIMGGKKRSPYWDREPTTIWLAAERENAVADLLPFGWLLVERAESQPNEELPRWCKEELGRLDRPGGADPAGPGKPLDSPRQPQEQVWNRARLKYNAKNGTLTAVGPANVKANALAPEGPKLLATLPPAIQAKVKANEFVRVTARVRGAELIAVEGQS